MRIELVGGPCCGMVLGEDRAIQTVVKIYAVADKAWEVSYTRTGERTEAHNMRYVYAGQKPLLNAPSV